MRIDARFETINGSERPVFFFSDEIERDKTIGGYSEAEGHITASRAYMRRCRKPETSEDLAQIWAALARYAARCSKIYR